jgi:ATP-dependent helicase/nuclease subunit A
MADARGEPRLTAEQSAAVAIQPTSVSLSAAAGSGKTFVLTRRFLAHLDGHGESEPAPLDELVAITFTEKAAREMRDRIGRECRRRMNTGTEDESDAWLTLLRRLPHARISTIHGFCGALLRAFPVEAGLDPYFQTLDDIQTTALWTEVLSETLREQLSERHLATMEVASAYSLWSLRNLISEFAQGARPADWDRWRDASPDEVLAHWRELFHSDTRPRLLRDFQDDAHTQYVLELLARVETNHAKMQERIAFLQGVLPTVGACEQPESVLSEIVDQSRIKGGGTVKNWTDASHHEQVKDALDALRKKAAKVTETLVWDEPTARVAAQYACWLMQAAEPVYRAYELRKREANCLDFDDLIARAHRLLHDDHPHVRAAVSRGIRLLLIDEFQDTDPVQAELIERIVGLQRDEGRLFFVGDPQQSIYRFRGADPRIFARLRGALAAPGRLALTQNFRSQPAILHFVNWLFQSGLAQGEAYQPLRPSLPQVTPEPAIEFLWALPQEGEESPPPSADGDGETRVGRYREARWIARRLREMIDGGEPIVRDTGTSGAGAARGARPGDIAILFRALSDLSIYEMALRQAGLPYYVVGGHAFYAQQEVFDLLNLLRAVSQSLDEVALLGVLRSPMFSLSDETLFWLKADQPSIREALFLETLPQGISPEQQQRVRRAAETLRSLEDEKDRVPIARLVQMAFERTAYDAAVLGEFMGARKLANLEKLIELARSFDASGLFTLDDYVTQLADFVANQPKEPPAPTEPEDSDVVRLMTIHQAKGLEFPVVCLPDVARRAVSARDQAKLDAKWGPLVKLPADTPDSDGLHGLKLWKLEEKSEDEAERLRIFYVATTRAADYLLLSSGLKEFKSSYGNSPLLQLLHERFDLQTGQPRIPEHLQPTMPYDRVRVRVTLAEPPPPRERPEFHGRADLTAIADAAQSLKSPVQPRLVGAVSPDRQAARTLVLARSRGTLELATPEFAAVGDDALMPYGLDHAQEETLFHETLVRAMFEQMDFRGTTDLEALAERLGLQLHLPGHPRTDPHAAAEVLHRFQGSDLAEQLHQARRVWRGLPFLLAWPDEGPNAITIEGVLDCVFEDSEGERHLVILSGSEAQSHELDLPGVVGFIQSLAVERFFGKRAASVDVYEMANGSQRRVDLSPQSLATYGRQLAELMVRAHRE